MDPEANARSSLGLTDGKKFLVASTVSRKKNAVKYLAVREKHCGGRQHGKHADTTWQRPHGPLTWTLENWLTRDP